MRDYYIYRVSENLAEAIFEPDGEELLTDREQGALQDFYDELPRGYEITKVEDSENEFGLCELTNLRGATVDIRVDFEDGRM